MDPIWKLSESGCDLNPADFKQLAPSEFVVRSTEYYNSIAHNSISEIENKSIRCPFKFQPIDVGAMAKFLGSLDHRKATSCKRKPARVLAQYRLVIYQLLTNIFNNCTSYCVFPDLCKLAEIRPIYKTSDPLDEKDL